MSPACLVIASALLATVYGVQGSHSPGSTEELRGKIDGLIRDSGAQKVAVAFRDLGSRRELYIGADEPFHAASTTKVPVMLEVFRLAEAHALSLDDRVTVKTTFTSLADGSPYTLSPNDDSDRDLYQRAGQTATVRDLVERMISMSSNLATNLLIERVGADHVTAFMEKLGTKDVHVLRGVMDDKAFDRGLNNMTSARGMSVLLTAMGRRRAVSSRASDEMVRILLAQQHNEGIPVGLPADWRCAHKTGWLTGTSHDAAIVYPPGRKPYVLVVLTRGIQDADRANRLIADISRAIAGILDFRFSISDFMSQSKILNRQSEIELCQTSFASIESTCSPRSATYYREPLPLVRGEGMHVLAE